MQVGGKLSRKIASFCFLFSLMVVTTTNVYASGVGNAVSDIMNDKRFKGAISSIEWLTSRVDHWFTVIITATAFFIISAALLKNTCAAAYVSNHKFWDKVAEAHEKSDALSLAGIKDYFTGKQFMQTSATGFKDFFLGIIPNIKALTDFDDADIEPKAYFMKAIPQMLGCVIIGVFIYNGYYRDTAATVGSFGSEICNRVFASVDPATFVDKLTQTTKAPDNIFANDSTLQGKDAHTISKDIYKLLISKSKGLTEENAKESLMRDCENVAYMMVNNQTWEDKFYGPNRKYDFSAGSVKVTLVNSTPAGYSGSFEHPTVLPVNESTDDKYTVVAFGSVPKTAAGYVEGTSQILHISLVMSGTAKDTSKNGITSLTASEGKWNASAAGSVTINIPADAKESNGKTGDAAEYSCKWAIGSSADSSLLASVQEYCASNNLTYIDSFKVTSWSQYDGNNGMTPQVIMTGPVGTQKTMTASVTFRATSADDGQPQTFMLNVPVTFVL